MVDELLPIPVPCRGGVIPTFVVVHGLLLGHRCTAQCGAYTGGVVPVVAAHRDALKVKSLLSSPMMNFFMQLHLAMISFVTKVVPTGSPPHRDRKRCTSPKPLHRSCSLSLSLSQACRSNYSCTAFAYADRHYASTLHSSQAVVEMLPEDKINNIIARGRGVVCGPIHVNLIRLRGFCSEGTKRQLVYDYMLDGCLDHHLFCGNVVALNCRRRFTIILKGAKELAYLHEKYRDCIITSENILLDGDFHPKVEDMGIAKLVGRDYSTVLRGTFEYLVTEWICGLPIVDTRIRLHCGQISCCAIMPQMTLILPCKSSFPNHYGSPHSSPGASPPFPWPLGDYRHQIHVATGVAAAL
ncbi:hypothetical protein Taro_019325 [Colocasia esculenta]|uniref:Protein kinase domain-containing protein n=1 Tax=Colocasia esculenta TaxID=4460 RepID=A0A843UKT8_COLES|nr:hypothetical protein [Colocasia esculenta]